MGYRWLRAVAGGASPVAGPGLDAACTKLPAACEASQARSSSWNKNHTLPAWDYTLRASNPNARINPWCEGVLREEGREQASEGMTCTCEGKRLPGHFPYPAAYDANLSKRVPKHTSAFAVLQKACILQIVSPAWQETAVSHVAITLLINI